MKLYSVLIALGLGFVLLGFQNCTKTAFTASSSSAEKSSRSLVPTDSTNTTASAADPLQPGSPPADTSVPAQSGTDAGTSGDVSSGSRSDDRSGHNTGHNEVASDSSKSPSPEGDDKDLVRDDDFVICILKGKGKSMKLGMLTEDLGGVHAVVQTVCISRKECLENVAKSFEVEAAEHRGFCAHNPHVEHLSDEDVDKLLAVETTPSASKN